MVEAKLESRSDRLQSIHVLSCCTRWHCLKTLEMLVPVRPPPLIPAAALGGPEASLQIVCQNPQRSGKRLLLKLQQDVGREASGWH